MLHSWHSSPFLLFGSKHPVEGWEEFLNQEPVNGLCSEETWLVEFGLEQVSGSHFMLPTWLAHHHSILHTDFPILKMFLKKF